MTKEEWNKPPSSAYLESIKNLSLEDLYDNYNPGF